MAMELHPATKENLGRDRLVVVKAWGKVYGGYFSDERVLNAFIRAGRKHWEALPKNPRVLYVCSGNGLLGERLAGHLRKEGLNPKLTIVDASKEQLEQNPNPATRKLRLDVLNMDLNEKFDLIIMRSSLDYQHTPELQVQMLERIARHLKPDGIFLNQAASFRTKTERDLADDIYKTTPQIGDRHFQWHGDLGELHDKAGLEKPKKLGEAPVLRLTHEDHASRYGITHDDVKRIQEMIRRIPRNERKAIKTTTEGYEIKCQFPIYATRLKKR